jgi:hypothetical protein
MLILQWVLGVSLAPFLVYAADVIQLEKIDSVWLRKTALNFEKRISQNAELRAKFEDHPEK